MAPVRHRPKIVVSAVSSELGTARQAVANILTRRGYDADFQEIFATEYGDIDVALRRHIDQCDGLIQIVGWSYGTEAPEPDPELGRVSYTQFEYLYAKSRGKQTWIFLIKEGYPLDRPLNELDLPSVGSESERRAIQSELQQRQREYRERLSAGSQFWHDANSQAELELSVERIPLGERPTLPGCFHMSLQWRNLGCMVTLALGLSVVVLINDPMIFPRPVVLMPLPPDHEPVLFNNLSPDCAENIRSATVKTIIRIAKQCDDPEILRLAERYKDDPEALLKILKEKVTQ